ncbi:hypothetical protein SAMN04488490_1839 [Marinobacter sp. LV10R510-11A]|uniref:hypothetical protein n=1 Tax=Marinobacter sp. LV10R510-11A TaxID=1415568 RepID=UPI000BB77E15|nr:hypothetical protein [Marinobacter sp. LV10R510-11A]SOB76162.1 hypothetical protein SAMN04488490_1839 [Marinobacter sp. LV10R510-11A]
MNTQGTISNAPKFTREQLDKTNAFFARIVTIYGQGRAKTLWGNSSEQLKVMRREWASTISKLSLDDMEALFGKLKKRLAAGDPDYKWPEIPRMLALLNEQKRKAAYQVFQPGQPEPAWRSAQRRVVGRIASQTAIAVLHGGACFIEDRPGH